MKTAKTTNPRILKGYEVFPAREIPHLWAHGLPSTAKIRNGGANNLSAIGDTIYSYEYCPIARRHEHKNGEVAFLISSESRSSTTQNHTYKTRRAVQNLGSIHDVSPQFWKDIAASKHQDIATFYNTKISKLMVEILSHRTRNKARAQILIEIDRIVATWRGLHKAFRFRCDLACVTADISDIRDRVKKKNCPTNKFTKENEKEREKAFDKLAHWRKTGNMDGAKISAIPYPVLRLHGENLHTSYGARIPITEARRLLDLIPSILIRAEGRSTESIGGFGGVRVESDALNVGCHKIPWVEVRGFCDFVSWPIPENFPI